MNRALILALLFSAMAINILDRQVLSLVAPVLRDRFALSNFQYSTIVFCFLLGMTLGQLPAGTLMDRRGPRVGFSLTLAAWSMVNALHSLASGFVSFCGIRFLMGVAECGTYPGGVRVIGQHFPDQQRALAGGIFNAGSLAGSILAPPLIVAVLGAYGWQAAFIVPSAIGLLWLIPWLAWYREPVAPVTSPADTGVGWLFRERAAWGVMLMRACGGPVTSFYWYWLPEYLKRERGLSMEWIGAMGWLPFFFGGVGNIGGGFLSSWLMRRGWPVDRARKTAFGLAVALCLAAVAVPGASSAEMALALICVATMGINALAANLIGLVGDLFPVHLQARAMGMAGAGDGVVSMITTLATGWVVDRFSYAPIFAAAGILPMLSLVSLFGLVGRIERKELA